MKRFFQIVALVLACVGMARAQGAPVNDAAILNVAGILKSIGGATVTVCTLGSLGLPCVNPVTIYSDAALQNAIGLSMTADPNGNYSYFVAPGDYTETVTASGVTGRSIPRRVPFGNPLIISNSGGTFTTQAQYVQSIVGTCSPATEWAATQAGGQTIDAMSSCIGVPTTASHNVNAVAGYANIAAGVSATGGYFQARCLGINCNAFALATMVQDLAGVSTSNVGLSGFNINVQPLNAAASYNGLTAGIILSLGAPNAGIYGNGIVCNLFSPNPGMWGTCFESGNGATLTGAAYGAQAASGTSIASQKLLFSTFDSGAVQRQSGIFVTGAQFLGFRPAAASVPEGDLDFTALSAARTYSFPDVAGTMVLTAATQTLTSKTLGSPTINLLTNGTGVQIFNTTTTCTTGASVGATCTTGAITLPVAEADTSYRVTCTGKGLTAVPVVIGTTNSSATQFTITIAALTAVAASFASYDCTVGHT